ncbi:hypothetical protein E4U17_006793 [Claviceps sp. LM77 group G4]|nr:hypothetical protein E4U17_006793 [Claviceps sp. LM77 group G4]KAG6059306.1 hypothetical protein E4U33_007130 [Claviceps sp. LM78 group G4]KAG6073037.1 hypothetical protein E4U16_004941 [Claviceps sp. LM84 group G4]
MEVLNTEPPDEDLLNSAVLFAKVTSVSAKVTSVLSVSFSDSEFRDTLSLFDQRMLPNDAKSRRKIRLDLQKDVLECNGLVIDRFGRVVEQLSHVRDVLDTLNTEYETMKSQIELAQSETSSILKDAVVLLKERDLLRNRQGILRAFKDRLVMTEVDLVTLTSTAEPLDHRFYTALYKARTITQDCELLLGLEKQTFGLDLMEQASKHLNLGFHKLHNWLQREFKALSTDHPQISSSVRRALRVLAERPSLFKTCINSFSEARERIMTEAFHVALTGTSSSGVVNDTINPIDLTAYDTMRHVGDMLAWVHAATVSEREALEILFVSEGEELDEEVNACKNTEVWQLAANERGLESEFDALKTLSDLVDKNLSGTTRQLQQRVEQAIQTNEETVPSYRLATLLSFYRTVFDNLLGSTTNVSESVRGLESEAKRQFRSLIKDAIASVQGESQSVSVDSAPPKFFINALEQLRLIMQSYDSSLTSHANKESEFELVLSSALEPYLSVCENMADMMTPLKGSIFTINVNKLAEECLSAFNFTQRRAAQLRQKVKDEASKVVESQYEFFRLGSGLEPALFERADGTTIIKLDPTEHAVSLASERLDDFLPSAVMDANDRISEIQNAPLARKITAEAAEMFCQDFEKWERETRKEGQYMASNQKAAYLGFPRTSGDIRVLLL